MPIYPAAMSTVAQPLMAPGPWRPARVTAAVLCFVALVLVISGSFLPLYSGELDVGFDSIEVTFTPWAVELDENIGDGVNDVPRVGYPMVFSAVILACAAAACWYAATPAARPVAGRTAGVVTSVSSAFLIGTTWTTALLVSNGVDALLLLGVLSDGVDTDGSYLTGYWLLLTSCLLAFVAAVLSLLPTRQPAWQPPPPPVNPFVETPPYGIAIPAEPPPAGHALRIDPLTGQPLGHGVPSTAGPFGGVPAAQPFQRLPVGPMSPQPPLPEPTSPHAGLPATQPPHAAVDPLTGQPLAPTTAVDPLTGQPLPAGSAVPVSPPAGIPAAEPLPFTAAPVGPVNGLPPAPMADPAPIVLPDAPPLPEAPPGPAVPATEDPLAEPPRS